MNLRYDFGEKVDFIKFQKQVLNYIGTGPQSKLDFYFPNYRVCVNVESGDCSPIHNVSFELYDIHRDRSGSIVKSSSLNPLNDSRFKDLKIIQTIYDGSGFVHHGLIYSDDLNYVVDLIVTLVKTIYKFDHLKVFL